MKESSFHVNAATCSNRDWNLWLSLIPELARKNHFPLPIIKDTLAERLRRRPAKPMGSPRVGSNPTGVVFGCNVFLTKFTPASIAQWQSVSLVN